MYLQFCHTKKLCSRLLSRVSGILLAKTAKSIFVPPSVGLRGSSMASWKALGRLPISAN